MKIIALLSVLASAALTFFVLRENRKTNNKLNGLKMVYEEILKNESQSRDNILRLAEEISLLLGNIQKLYIIIDVLKLNSSYAVQSTVINLISNKKVPSIRETSILLLQNLVQEYNANILEVKNKIAVSEDDDEKNRFKKIVEELESLTNLVSTISNESSDEYIDQIYNEVFLCVKKIKNV